ncbi:hypothetical protein FGIG_10206, partial [Fasciola gigantica]
LLGCAEFGLGAYLSWSPADADELYDASQEPETGFPLVMSRLIALPYFVTISLFGLGVLTMVLSAWGITAVWLERKSLLYSIRKLYNRFLEISVQKYESIDSNKVRSHLFATVMHALQCCGNNGASDFDKSEAFTRNDTIRGISYSPIQYPIHCCARAFSTDRNACPLKFTPENSNIEIGCKDMFDREFLFYVNVTGGSLLGFAALEVLLTVLAVLVWRRSPVQEDFWYEDDEEESFAMKGRIPRMSLVNRTARK